MTQRDRQNIRRYHPTARLDYRLLRMEGIRGFKMVRNTNDNERAGKFTALIIRHGDGWVATTDAGLPITRKHRTAVEAADEVNGTENLVEDLEREE